jgi:hypothetical protein
MRRGRAGAALLLLLGFALPGGASAQSTSGFNGRYRLTLTFGPGCSAKVASVAISLDLRESAVAGGSEIDGRPVITDEFGAAQVVLLRQAASLHGPLGTEGTRTDREPITTGEGLLATLWLVLDGSVTSTSGRPEARGTAVGLLKVGRFEDEDPGSLGVCTASDHTWSLAPQ